MQFNEYQKQAILTDLAGGKPQPITSPAFFDKLLGLVGETGEVAEKFKKIYRDDNSELSAEKLVEIKKELGDVLWYISVMGSYLGISLDDIASYNVEKLKSRQTRGALKGSGDSR